MELVKHRLIMGLHNAIVVWGDGDAWIIGMSTEDKILKPESAFALTMSSDEREMNALFKATSEFFDDLPAGHRLYVAQQSTFLTVLDEEYGKFLEDFEDT